MFGRFSFSGSCKKKKKKKKKKKNKKTGEIIQYSVLVCLDASMQILGINSYL